MNGKPLAHFTRVLFAGCICMQATSSTAETTARKSQTEDHACSSLMRPTLEAARRDTQQIAADKIRSQIADLANKLGRDPYVQATLECLMRYQAQR
jgi:hypothetical protein